MRAPLRPAAVLPCLLLVSLVGCSKLTTPSDERVTVMPEPVVAAAEPTPPPTPPPAPTPAPTPAPPPPQPRISASHILVSYKGAKSADPAIKRTKEEAKKLAEQLDKQARAPKADFAAMAKKNSDDKGSGAKGGDLGSFTAGSMVKPFSDAAFALKPGAVSDVVESEFGFHVIKRAP